MKEDKVQSRREFEESDRGIRRWRRVYISTELLMFLIYEFGGFDRTRTICDSNERLIGELTVMLAEGNDEGGKNIVARRGRSE